MLKNLTATCGWQQRLRQLYEAGMSNMPISLRRKQAGRRVTHSGPFLGEAGFKPRRLSAGPVLPRAL